MNHSEGITERSLYPIVLDLVRRIGSEAGVKVTGVSEVRVEDRYPDIILHLGG